MRQWNLISESKPVTANVVWVSDGKVVVSAVWVPDMKQFVPWNIPFTSERLLTHWMEKEPTPLLPCDARQQKLDLVL